MAISGGDGSIILTTKVDETGLKKGLGSMKKLAATAGKAFLAIGAAAATATVAITKMAVSAYADYEQLVGGVETLFKDSAGKVLEYANQAFQTAGVSANEYMQQVTSFSASLLSSLAGDTDKAADVANMALIDISDNANKMGSSLESVTLAYQGFAKGQYMLLDNLKLGYGGTKTEMERLLKDAEAYLATQGKTAKFSIDNLADVYTAINAIQQKLDIAGTTMNEAETTITGSLGMVKASWQNLLTAMAGGGDLDRAINNFVYSLEKFTASIVPVIERTLLGLGQAIQRTLPMLVQTVVSALVQQIPNLVMAVYNMIVGLFKGIVLGIKALFTGGTAKATEVIKGNIQTSSAGASAMADHMNDVADATKKAGKEAKKSLAAFDELNILSSGGSGAGETPEASMPTINAGGGGGGLLQDMGGMTQTITTELAAIMAVAGGALLAIGLLLLFSGHIIWGISLIIAGAVTFGVAMQTLTQQDTTGVISEQLMTILGIAGVALTAIGLILLFSGSFLWGIAFIIAGASALSVAVVALKQGKVSEEAEEMLINIMTIAGTAMLALGVILLCFGVVSPLSIGLVVAGAASLAGAIALNPQLVFENVSKFLTDNAGLIVGISLALLVLGIILCCTGVALPLGIGLIVVGAAGLAAEVALNWDFIKDKTIEIFNNIMNWVKTWGLLILGIILVVSGVGIPLGIALMKKGGANLTEAQDPLWTAIVDKVKEVWETIKTFWNTHIAKYFTAEWWGNLGKKMINGLIKKVVEGLNKLIEKINSFGFDLPDVLGGGRVGFNISKITPPQLAQGTVVPPNRKFLAMLGDNTKEHEIVSPVSTMKQAFMEAMIEMGGNFGGGSTEVVLEIDGREFGRAVVEQGNRENRRIGTRLVIA